MSLTQRLGKITVFGRALNSREGGGYRLFLLHGNLIHGDAAPEWCLYPTVQPQA